jgi:hypothetical protein
MVELEKLDRNQKEKATNHFSFLALAPLSTFGRAALKAAPANALVV